MKNICILFIKYKFILKLFYSIKYFNKDSKFSSVNWEKNIKMTFPY